MPKPSTPATQAASSLSGRTADAKPSTWRSWAYGLLLAAFLALLALHRPWTGYTTRIVPENVDTLSLLARCPGIASPSRPETTHEELLAHFAENLDCARHLQPLPIPIKLSRWRSRAPALHMFGRLRNAAAAAALLLAAALGVAVLGRRSRKRRPVELRATAGRS